MNFTVKELSEIVGNIMKKVTHDLSNPMSAIMNASEILRLQENNPNNIGNIGLPKAKLRSIFYNASDSLTKKINILRYLFNFEYQTSNTYDEEIFIEIVHDFENRNCFHLNFDFDNHQILFKKILLYCLVTFSYFIFKDSIVNFNFDEKFNNFNFNFQISLENAQEFNKIIEFLSKDLNYLEDKKFVDPIEVFIFYFKIFLKTDNFAIESHFYDSNRVKIIFSRK
jgi:hypothetical protein